MWSIDHLYRLLDVLFKIEAEPFKTYRGKHCGGHFLSLSLSLSRTSLASAIISPLLKAVAMLTTTKSLRYQSSFIGLGAGAQRIRNADLSKLMNHIFIPQRKKRRHSLAVDDFSCRDKIGSGYQTEPFQVSSRERFMLPTLLVV
jgi:hypothetical protein